MTRGTSGPDAIQQLNFACSVMIQQASMPRFTGTNL